MNKQELMGSALLALMSDASGVSVDDITSKSRKRPLPGLRSLICEELVKHKLTHVEIAEVVNVDRSTITHYVHDLAVAIRLHPTDEEKALLQKWDSSKGEVIRRCEFVANKNV